MNERYIALLQRRIGTTSVGPSTARGMGPPGTIQAARAYLQTLDLRAFQVRSERTFVRELDRATEELRRSLPARARNWGSARKFLNIFLRGCFYNRYLCRQYTLQTLEPWLELPLDSHTAKGLRNKAARRELPRWKSVISLTAEHSAALQAFAASVGKSEGVSRVHLDLLFWRPQDA